VRFPNFGLAHLLSASLLATTHCGALFGINDIAYVANEDAGGEGAEEAGQGLDGDAEGGAFAELEAGVDVLSGADVDGLDASSGDAQSHERIAIGDRHVCAIDPAGRTKCFGANDRGQFGNGLVASFPDPGTLTFAQVLEDAEGHPFAGATTLVAGGDYTCALRAGRVHCWGNAAFGATGQPLGTTTSTALATLVEPDILEGVESVAAGGFHTCARIPTGVVCWGSNAQDEISGQLSLRELTPVVVPGLSAIRGLALGGSFSLGFDDARTPMGWGENSVRQCGSPGGAPCLHLEGATCLPSLTRIELGPVRAMAAGPIHACAITTNDRVFCWGNNTAGECGAQARTDCVTPLDCSVGPTAVALGPGVERLALGSGHSCALRDGKVWCWGVTLTLGRGGSDKWPEDSYAQPARVIKSDGAALDRVVDLAAGGNLTCALTTSQILYCWGTLPTGARADFATPLPW
jgi:alpha-tubulin suppressor-like RCC1 family protein